MRHAGRNGPRRGARASCRPGCRTAGSAYRGFHRWGQAAWLPDAAFDHVVDTCLKSGNATILRGGSEAINSNRAIAACIQQGLAVAELPAEVVQVVETTDRAAVGALITMPEFVDVIVPRGGKSLIERVSRDAKVPVIKHLDGVCHVFPLF